MSRAAARKVALWRELEAIGRASASELSEATLRPISSIHKDLCDLERLGAVSASSASGRRHLAWSVNPAAKLEGESFTIPRAEWA